MAEEKEKAGCAGAIIVGAIMLIAILLIGKYSADSGPVSSEQERAGDMAQTFVLKKLISPATAKFSPEEETTITASGDGSWIVNGWVDSHNVYGALVRQNYRVTLRSLGNRQWEASEVRLAER